MELALDLGTRCGWAVRGRDGAEQWGVWELDAHGLKGDAPRLDLFARQLTRALDQWAVTAVLVEEPFIASIDSLRTSRVLLGLLAFAQVIAFRRKLPLQLINPAHIKVGTIGATSRKAAKGERSSRGRVFFKGPDVLAALNLRRAGQGLPAVDDPNAAIAVAMLDLAAAERAGTGPLVETPAKRAIAAAKVAARKAGLKAAKAQLRLPGNMPLKARGRRRPASLKTEPPLF